MLHISRIRVNTYCFPTATVVVRTRFYYIVLWRRVELAEAKYLTLCTKQGVFLFSAAVPEQRMRNSSGLHRVGCFRVRT
jgi:hypothetical protein